MLSLGSGWRTCIEGALQSFVGVRLCKSECSSLLLTVTVIVSLEPELYGGMRRFRNFDWLASFCDLTI